MCHTVGGVPVWLELCGGCSPAAGCPLKEKDDDDDGGCTYPIIAVPQETPEHFGVCKSRVVGSYSRGKMKGEERDMFWSQNPAPCEVTWDPGAPSPPSLRLCCPGAASGNSP